MTQKLVNKLWGVNACDVAQQNMSGNCVGLVIYFVTIQNDILNVDICHHAFVIRIYISKPQQTSCHHPDVDLRLRLLKTFSL